MICAILVIILFIFLGIIFSLGKGSFLISGFNTLSKEEQAQYDVLSLCKFMGKLMFMIAFCMSLFVLSEILMLKILYDIAFPLIIGSIIFSIIYMNTGNRFKKK